MWKTQLVDVHFSLPHTYRVRTLNHNSFIFIITSHSHSLIHTHTHTHTHTLQLCHVKCMHLSTIVHSYGVGADAVTIVLFQVLGAFANRPFDPLLNDQDRSITATDVRTL